MDMKEFQFGKSISTWKNGKAQTITFVVTEDCILRCKYCYITHKSSNKKMNFNTAQKFIDYLYEGKFEKQDAVIIEFIGGEPMLEIDLIDKITDYFKVKSFLMDDKWFWNYRISICTNGVNYEDSRIQNYIQKNIGKLSLGITLDGTKEKHDLNRVFPNGEGSYDSIVKTIPKWLQHFSPSTKVTFASDDLIYLKDSIINLYNLGITEISANVVFENVWKEDDDKLFERQLIELADYVIEHNLFNKFKCSLFDEGIGGFYNKEDKQRTYCGAGKMIAIDPEGKLFPCIRYKDYSLNNKPEWTIGDVEKGVDMEKVRPFMVAMNAIQSDDECLNCEVAVGCGFCQGFNYDEAETSTNFSRAKYICKMHKARVRANDYYFSRLFNEHGIERSMHSHDEKKLYFILDSNYGDYCSIPNPCLIDHEVMGVDIIEKGLEYARNNFFSPIFIHSRNEFNYCEFSFLNKYTITHYVPAIFYKEASILKKKIFIFHEGDVYLPINNLENAVLLVDEANIQRLNELTEILISKTSRLNVVIQNISKNFNLQCYENELKKMKDTLIIENKKSNRKKQINVLTDNFSINEHNHCKAGDRSFALSPKGEIYVCPLYYSFKQEPIGNLDIGLGRMNNGHLYKIENSPLCKDCLNFQCMNCVFLNKSITNEVNVSPSFQCKKASLEKRISYDLLKETDTYVCENFEVSSVMDPIETFFEETKVSKGYYKLNDY